MRHMLVALYNTGEGGRIVIPTISMFYGIIIRMYDNGEHNPPHFHAEYQGHKAVFEIF